jgi:hypothetical protein
MYMDSPHKLRQYKYRISSKDFYDDRVWRETNLSVLPDRINVIGAGDYAWITLHLTSADAIILLLRHPNAMRW